MKYITVLLFCALGFASSCSNMLDQYSHSAIPPEAVTEKDLPALRLGMYNRVQNEPQTRSFIMCDILGGDITQSNYNPIDVINSTLSPLNSAIVNGWNGYYSALYQVNNLLAVTAKFPDSEISVRARGEAHYFRAYIYFCLVSRWGGVPLLRENTLDKLPRSPAADVWALIEEDLDTAASLLDTSESYYYVSRNAALALKARVMLSQGKMTEAARLAEDLITSGPYKLDSFDKIFRKKANTEIIFAFENISEESSINISDLFYTYGHPNKGQGVYRLPASTVELFGANDTRKEMSVINIAGTDCLNKYPSGQTGKDPVIVSRIAELYLISAEAQGRAKGVGRLNELRRERGLDDIYPASDAAYVDAVLDERRRELLGENFIYHDMVRTGRAVERLGIQKFQLLLPIPGKELQLNPLLELNPGY